MNVLHKLSDFLLTEGAPPAGPLGALQGFVPIVLIALIVYFMMLRPTNRERKQRQEMLSTLKKDDEIVTTSGIWGRIVSLNEREVVLEIADKVKIRMLRDRIAGRWENNAPVGNAAAPK
jgi:preprotein translocase subunit YajC